MFEDIWCAGPPPNRACPQHQLATRTNMEATDNAQPLAPTPRRRMRATRYDLFARNGHLVLRCHSPDAIGGFYNLDIHREPNAIVLRNMRKRGEHWPTVIVWNSLTPQETLSCRTSRSPNAASRKRPRQTARAYRPFAIGHGGADWCSVNRGRTVASTGWPWRMAVSSWARTSTPRWTRSRRS